MANNFLTQTKNKDWTGDGHSVYTTIGASNHTDDERETNDFYATSPKAVRYLLELETFDKNILEPCCGNGHISETLKQFGYNVTSMDLIEREYKDATFGVDFLNYWKKFSGHIITNPPYKYAQEFVEHSLSIVEDGHKVAMFLKLTFLEGKRRKELFKKQPPKIVYVSSSRLGCAKNGEFNVDKDGELDMGGAVAFAWFVWKKGYTGDTIIKWFN